jgi:mono/diheme cytochrome c family protein
MMAAVRSLAMEARRMPPIRATLLALALASTLALTVPAAAQDMMTGDVAAGERLALTVCAQCHVVAERQPHPNPPVANVPSFFELAARNEVTPFWLRAFFRTPHRAMPDLILKPAEVDNIIAYIMSLKPGMKRKQ